MSTNYRSDPRINASLLKTYRDYDPEIAEHKRYNPSPSTPAMQFGTLVHGILELKGSTPPEFVISPYDSFRTNAAKDWKKQQTEMGNYIITQDELDRAHAMANRVLNHTPERIRSIIATGRAEVDFYTKTEKALLDVVSDDGKVGLDYKTTLATSERGFIRECYKYHYPLQAAHYVDVAGLDEFIFVGVSHTAPHPVWCLSCSSSFLDYGREEKDLAYKAMEQCANRVNEIHEVQAPPWVELDGSGPSA